jgi:ABC-type spermidine/putrescine transport system permease subunit II
MKAMGSAPMVLALTYVFNSIGPFVPGTRLTLSQFAEIIEEHSSLSDAVLIAVISSTTVNVIGTLIIVLKSLLSGLI